MVRGMADRRVDNVPARVAAVLALTEADLAEQDSRRLTTRKHRQLQDAAKILGLTGVLRLKKEDLARRVWKALKPLLVKRAGARTRPGAPRPATSVSATVVARPAAVPAAVPAAPSPRASAPSVERARPAVVRTTADKAPPRAAAPARATARARVVALAVDPDRLFVHWTVPAAVLDQARASAARDAGPHLRIFDVSGRIFDGSNARGFLDHPIDALAAGQCFLELRRPGTEVVVEIGVPAVDGRFLALARSKRTAFPRRDPLRAPRPPGGTPPAPLPVAPAEPARDAVGGARAGFDSVGAGAELDDVYLVEDALWRETVAGGGSERFLRGASERAWRRARRGGASPGGASWGRAGSGRRE